MIITSDHKAGFPQITTQLCSLQTSVPTLSDMAAANYMCILDTWSLNYMTLNYMWVLDTWSLQIEMCWKCEIDT